MKRLAPGAYVHPYAPYRIDRRRDRRWTLTRTSGTLNPYVIGEYRTLRDARAEVSRIVAR